MVAIALATLNFIGFMPRIVVDTARVGINYITLQRDLPLIALEQMQEDIATAVTQTQRPFVLATGEDFARVRAHLADPSGDDFIHNATSYVLEQAACLLSTEPVRYYFADGRRLLEVSRETLNRIITLGFAWQVTGNERYAQRAWQELAQVCSFPNWNHRHFLDTAEMALAVAVGYDWFYDAFTTEQKDLLANTIYRFAFARGNPRRVLSNWWSWSQTNWNHVCFGGLGIASMALAHRFPAHAADFLQQAFYSMPIAMAQFRPHGAYVEGNSYWDYGASYLVYFISTARNFLGSDYGLSQLPGFYELGYFALHFSTPTWGAFNAGDNRNSPLWTPINFWFARENQAPMLAAFQRISYHAGMVRPSSPLFPATGIRVTVPSTLSRQFALSCLWLDPSMNEDFASLEFPTSVHLQSDVGEEFVFMRERFGDPFAAYVGIKGGNNNTNHGDLDIGNFIFESQGIRWFHDLGRADRNTSGFFNNLVLGGRWRNYRKRAEGHNTLVINPHLAMEDQYPFAVARFTSFENNTAVLDMTHAYMRHGVQSVTRELQMLPDYTGIRITDHIVCRMDSEIFWFAHTRADIEIAPDGRSAVLRQDGRSITATLGEDSLGVFTVMNAEPLPQSRARRNPDENRDYTKLTVHLQGVREAVICVTITNS